MGTGNKITQMSDNTKKKSKSFLKKVKSYFKKDKDVKQEATIEESLAQLNINDEIKQETEEKVAEEVESEEDEEANFTYEIHEDDKRNERLNSQTSEDSGYSERVEEGDISKSLATLQIDEKKKTKTLQNVKLKRAPIRKNHTKEHVHPYLSQDQVTPDINFKQINQVNKQTLSGGQVYLNSDNEINEINKFFDDIINNSNNGGDLKNIDEELEMVNEIIENDTDLFSTLSLLQQFAEENFLQDNSLISITPETNNPIEEFYEQQVQFSPLPSPESAQLYQTPPYLPLTPPTSDSCLSPMSGCSYLELSPNLPSPNVLDTYEEINPTNVPDFDKICQEPKLQSSPKQDKAEAETPKVKKQGKTLKNFKDIIYKEIKPNFENKECCKNSKDTSKLFFLERLNKLSLDERSNLRLRVAHLDLKHAEGILLNLLSHISKDGENKDLAVVIFRMITDKMLGDNSPAFLGSFGLDLLSKAALNCNKDPSITKYLVECVNAAVKFNENIVAGRKFVFENEVDKKGDNLLGACSRAGDSHADALYWLVRSEPNVLPLFDVHHYNTEGYSALHVACKLHTASDSYHHVVHILIKHGEADFMKGDSKGGDTPLHITVSSNNCDLHMVLNIFGHVPEAVWYDLANKKNRSFMSPLNYAKSALKSSNQQNYPEDASVFMKKCRKEMKNSKKNVSL